MNSLMSTINVNVNSQIKKEAEEIRNGKLEIKGYRNVEKMFEDILNKDDSSYTN